MDERLQFVTRRLAGETMAELCREFGISRKTGYKIFDRYPVQATLAPGSLLLVTMVLDGGGHKIGHSAFSSENCNAESK